MQAWHLAAEMCLLQVGVAFCCGIASSFRRPIAEMRLHSSLCASCLLPSHTPSAIPTNHRAVHCSVASSCFVSQLPDLLALHRSLPSLPTTSCPILLPPGLLFTAARPAGRRRLQGVPALALLQVRFRIGLDFLACSGMARCCSVGHGLPSKQLPAFQPWQPHLFVMSPCSFAFFQQPCPLVAPSSLPAASSSPPRAVAGEIGLGFTSLSGHAEFYHLAIPSLLPAASSSPPSSCGWSTGAPTRSRPSSCPSCCRQVGFVSSMLLQC